MLSSARLSQALANFPELVCEVESALSLPPKDSDYAPRLLQVFFDDVVVASTGPNGQLTTHLHFPVDYRPELIAIYGDEELLLAQVQGNLLVNRLPQAYLKEWTHYAS